MDIQEYKGTLTGKVVLITGAGGGIGLETSKCFAVMGAKVVLLDIDREKGGGGEFWRDEGLCHGQIRVSGHCVQQCGGAAFGGCWRGW